MSTKQYILIAEKPLDPSEIKAMQKLFENKNFRVGEGEVFNNTKFALNELCNYETLTHEVYSVDDINGVNISDIKMEFFIEINSDFTKMVQHFANVVKAHKKVEIAKMNLRDKLSEYDNTNPKEIIEYSIVGYGSLDYFSDELSEDKGSIESALDNFLSEHCIKNDLDSRTKCNRVH